MGLLDLKINDFILAVSLLERHSYRKYKVTHAILEGDLDVFHHFNNMVVRQYVAIIIDYKHRAEVLSHLFTLRPPAEKPMGK